MNIGPTTLPPPGGAIRTYAVRVLGCKVNQVEARQVETVLEAAGLRPTDDGPEPPDLCVIHTCAVTQAALSTSAQQVRALARGVRHVLVTGCGSAEDLGAAVPEGAIRVPAGPDWMARFRAELARIFPPTCGGVNPGGPGLVLRRFPNQTRAFLKIQDGCDLGCAYCIVPRLRGPSRSRPLDEVKAEARALAHSGHVEIVVTGVSVGLYGGEDGPPLVEALRAICATPGLQRVRLSSLHPAELTDELLAFWAQCALLAPHLHLPLQSGSDAVLNRMGRGYTVAEFLDAVERVRRRLDRPAFSTDVIAGFPGETEADFDRTRAICADVGFMRLHVFPFSVRPGTRAARLPDPVAPELVKQRAARLRALGRRLALRAHRAAVGRSVAVLCETYDATARRWRGYSERYLPVQFAGPIDGAGRMVRVRPTGADADGVTVETGPCD